MRSPRVIGRLLAATAIVAAGCSGESGGQDGALGGSVPAIGTPLPVSVPEGTATELAPSQLVGSTVPEPATPVPCSVDDIEIWTAQVAPADSTVDAVIRIRNAGDVRCDAGISRSPNLDPAIEPDVWLERKGTADLVVGRSVAECSEPDVVRSVEVAIGDEIVDVPTGLVTCGWSFTAYYPNDRARNGCERDALDLAVTPNALLVRNGSSQPCGLAGIVEVDGATVADERARGPSIGELMPGDVVAFGRRSTDACEGATVRVELFDEVARELIFDDAPCDLIFEYGGGRPWFEAAGGPLETFSDDPSAADVARRALDPFGAP